MVVERFARREGRMYLLDLARRAGAEMGRRSGRLVFRERFRLFLRRQFPEWTLAELSTEPNLEHSLSPAFPRAFSAPRAARMGGHRLPGGGRRGRRRVLRLDLARVLAPPRAPGDGGRAGALRAAGPRARRRAASALPQPGGSAVRTVSLFGRGFRFAGGPARPRQSGYPPGTLPPPGVPGSGVRWQGIAALPGVEQVLKSGGRVSLRVRGLEFAELEGEDLSFGLGHRHPAGERDMEQIERVAEQLDRARSPEAADRDHPLYRQYPEAWLESQARAHIQILDATLRPEPVYGQVPAFAGGERGILDLLAVDHTGRLVVVELKASADLHLPLQALDYWIRVKWHLDRGEFGPAGYFPGIELTPDRRGCCWWRLRSNSIPARRRCSSSSRPRSRSSGLG
jgi:hypothetical protein